MYAEINLTRLSAQKEDIQPLLCHHYDVIMSGALKDMCNTQYRKEYVTKST